MQRPLRSISDKLRLAESLYQAKYHTRVSISRYTPEPSLPAVCPAQRERVRQINDTIKLLQYYHSLETNLGRAACARRATPPAVLVRSRSFNAHLRKSRDILANIRRQARL
jgi:hypothetical protein